MDDRSGNGQPLDLECRFTARDPLGRFTAPDLRGLRRTLPHPVRGTFTHPSDERTLLRGVAWPKTQHNGRPHGRAMHSILSKCRSASIRRAPFATAAALAAESLHASTAFAHATGANNQLQHLPPAGPPAAPHWQRVLVLIG